MWFRKHPYNSYFLQPVKIENCNGIRDKEIIQHSQYAVAVCDFYLEGLLKAEVTAVFHILHTPER